MIEIAGDAALKIMATPKFAKANLTWGERPNHAGILIATALPEDDTGAIMPGLSIQLEVKKPILVERCLYEFGLFLLQDGARRRVYQLAVAPRDKRTHNGPSGPLFGPHEHIGGNVTTVDVAGVACGGLAAVFDLFCQRINLNFSGTQNFPL